MGGRALSEVFDDSLQTSLPASMAGSTDQPWYTEALQINTGRCYQLKGPICHPT
jgi:hypothetical protein